jgi:hypothetical protein
MSWERNHDEPSSIDSGEGMLWMQSPPEVRNSFARVASMVQQLAKLDLEHKAVYTSEDVGLKASFFSFPAPSSKSVKSKMFEFLFLF